MRLDYLTFISLNSQQNKIAKESLSFFKFFAFFRKKSVCLS